MADYWIDSVLGSGDNDGTTPANAVRGVSAIKTGFEVDHDAGTDIWVRRTSVYDEGVAAEDADIDITADGTIASPVRFIGWSRSAIPNTTIIEGDWTNGSHLVDNVVGITPKREAHQARWATAPDGHKYLITAILMEFTVDGMAGGEEFAVGEILTNETQTKFGKVWAFIDNLDNTGIIQAIVDSSSAWVNNDNITSDGGGDAELSVNAAAVGFFVDREYAGGTVTGVGGKFQIEKDEDYDNRPQAGIDAGWDADSHDLPTIDFNEEAYQLYVYSAYYLEFRNFNFLDSLDSNGVVYFIVSYLASVIGCIFRNSQNTEILILYALKSILNRFTIEGNGAGLAQTGLTLTYGLVKCKDGAIYNCGGFGCSSLSINVKSSNINLGIEMENKRADITPSLMSIVSGRDIALGGSNGYVDIGSTHMDNGVYIENYQKILGKHKSFLVIGETESIVVTDTNANKKLSDIVLKISPKINFIAGVEEWKQTIFVGDFDLSSGANTIKFWLYNDLGQTINDITAKDNAYLKASYIDSYGDVSEYTITEAFSTEIDILQAATADDWDYLQVSMTLATASRVKLELIVSIYDASDYFLIDKQPVIT